MASSTWGLLSPAGILANLAGFLSVFGKVSDPALWMFASCRVMQQRSVMLQRLACWRVGQRARLTQALLPKGADELIAWATVDGGSGGMHTARYIPAACNPCYLGCPCVGNGRSGLEVTSPHPGKQRVGQAQHAQHSTSCASSSLLIVACARASILPRVPCLATSGASMCVGCTRRIDIRGGPPKQRPRLQVGVTISGGG